MRPSPLSLRDDREPKSLPTPAKSNRCAEPTNGSRVRRRTNPNEEPDGVMLPLAVSRRGLAPKRGSAMTALGRMAQGLRCFASDIAQGFFEITHNGFALVGLATVCCAFILTARPDLREAGEGKLRSWLQARQEATIGMPI